MCYQILRDDLGKQKLNAKISLTHCQRNIRAITVEHLFLHVLRVHWIYLRAICFSMRKMLRYQDSLAIQRTFINVLRSIPQDIFPACFRSLQENWHLCKNIGVSILIWSRIIIWWDDLPFFLQQCRIFSEKSYILLFWNLSFYSLIK